MIDEATFTASRILLSLQRCRQRKDLELARFLYFQICENGFESDQELCNYVVSTLVDCRSMPDALHVFDRISNTNELSWTSLIQGWTECGYPDNSFNVFNRMQETFVCPSKHTFVAVLKACSQLKWLEQGQGIYTTVIQRGYEENPFVGNTMIDLYAKLGLLREAHQVLQRLKNRNSVTWNALITGYVEHGYDTDALRCLMEMESCGFSPDHVTFVCCLKACNSLGDADNGKVIHAKVTLKGVERAESVSITLLDMYVKCGLLMDAQAVFDKISDQTVALWTALITGFTEQGSAADALKCVEQMQVQGVSPDEAAFVCSLKACINIMCINKGQELHAEIVAKGMEKNTFVSNTLVDMYVKCAHLVEARHTFDLLHFYTTVSWNVLLTGYIDHGNSEEALSCLKQMQSAGTLSDATTFGCSLKVSGNLKAIDQGRETHGLICKVGFDKDVYISNTLMDMYARCGSLLEAQKVFDQLLLPNLVTWNTLITGYVEHARSAEALKFVKQMKVKGVHSDAATYICCLKACGQLKFLEEGMQMHIDIVKEGLEADPFVSNGLVDVYAKCGCLNEAQQLFERLAIQNVVSWSTLIAGFAEHERGDDALHFFKQMQAEGVSPNDITYIGSLKACGSIGAINRGLELHAEVINQFFETDVPDPSVQGVDASNEIAQGRFEATDAPFENVLIDMYCKCGSMLDAESIFDALPVMDTVVWNAIIAGYARQGESIVVLQLFEMMKKQGAQLNWITFLGVLTACSHAGLVDEGHAYFKDMDREYRVAPGLVHYNCIIDLLGRAGQFNGVLEVLNKMPLEPNSDTWHTLLGACSKWGNVELGRLAFAYAVKLDKSNAAAFIVMSNM